MGVLKVAILYGGRSVEHGVSINSARNIVEYIDRKLFTPVPIGITQGGQWFQTRSVNKSIAQGKPLSLQLNPKQPYLMSGRGKILVDIAFPLLHGTDGEDGSIQGLLKSLDLPVVGTGVLGSALSMNKIVAKRLLREAGIPVADFIPFGFTADSVCNDDRQQFHFGIGSKPCNGRSEHHDGQHEARHVA